MRPGTDRHRTYELTSGRPQTCSRRTAGPRSWAIRWVPGWRFTSPSAIPTSSMGSPWSVGRPASKIPSNALHESSATRRSRTHSSVTASTPSSIGGSTSRCSRRCRRALATTSPPGEHRRRPRVEPPARRHGHPRSPVGSARRAHDARARRLGRARRALHGTAAHRMSDAIGANATLRVIARCGTRVHREREPEFCAVLREWLGQGT